MIPIPTNPVLDRMRAPDEMDLYAPMGARRTRLPGKQLENAVQGKRVTLVT